MKNKIKHLWTIACMGSSIDQNTNNISLFGILEELQFSIGLKEDQSTINVPFQFEIVSSWERLLESHEANADILVEYFDPTNKKLSNVNYLLNIPKDKKRFRHNLKLNGIGLTTSGSYSFKISKKESGMNLFQEVGEVKIVVKIDKQINANNT